jgi:hypothetical protein
MPIQNLHRLNVFESRVVRNMFRSQTKKQQEAAENSITRDLKVFHSSYNSKGKFRPRTRPDGK